jgi:predicted SprT family Zn-dependent metalloprotease
MTPSQWKKQRSTHAQRLYEEYNDRVFYNKLPKSMAIQWSSRLAKTAGLTYTFFDYDKENTRIPGAKIELSAKVLTDLIRLRSTLLHEMCHAASWIIDHARKPPHGPVFQKWASRASDIYPCDAVTTCHSYKIHYKFRWKCSDNKCHWECGRHSQSVSIVKHRCGRCGAKIKFLGKFDANGDPMKERAPSAYSAFKQTMMESVQREHPHLDFGGIQRELARMWKVQKEK